MNRRGWAPADPMASSLALNMAQQRDLPRCGVCDQPSSKPLCHKCDSVLTIEQYGDPKKLRREVQRGCGGCGRLGDVHTDTCPVVSHG